MKSFSYSIKDKVGLHARPASKLVQSLNSYKSKVIVRFGEKEAIGKSLLNLMSLSLGHNDQVEFVIEGEDEDKLHADLPGILEGIGL